MATYIALLRAINVTGYGKLLMEDLRKLCTKAGFTDVRTYIQSGNVVFSAKGTAAKAKETLETALSEKLGKPSQAMIRTADEMELVIAANPYPEAEPNKLLILFLDKAPAAADAAKLKDWPIPAKERFTLIGRELFLHFPDGQGQSKLKVPFAAIGTGRNLNSARALLAMARGE